MHHLSDWVEIVMMVMESPAKFLPENNKPTKSLNLN